MPFLKMVKPFRHADYREIVDHSNTFKRRMYKVLLSSDVDKTSQFCGKWLFNVSHKNMLGIFPPLNIFLNQKTS